MPSREGVEALIARLGGETRSAVSKRTDVLLVGDSPGDTKISRAHELGVNTLWWPMAVHLGLFEERGEYRLECCPRDIISRLAITMATIAEDLYASGRLEAFARARDALECLLIGAYGPSRGTIGAGDEGRRGDSEGTSEDGT